MPVKAIMFDHNGQNVQAEVVYNFEELSNAVLVVPNNSTDDLSENILLIRDKSRWKTSSTLKKKYPSTFDNLISSVNEELKAELLSDHILLVGNYLS